eukprot:151385-Pelagomonas_calceolata.AAC.1
MKQHVALNQGRQTRRRSRILEMRHCGTLKPGRLPQGETGCSKDSAFAVVNMLLSFLFLCHLQQCSF